MTSTLSLSYARARLWLGITGVGAFVTLAAVWLATGAPRVFFGEVPAEPMAEALAIATFVLAGAVLTLPFEWIGGVVLPRRHTRPHASTWRWLARWLRGLAGVVALSVASGTALLQAGRIGGLPLAVLTLAVLASLVLWLQAPLARLVGCLRRVPTESFLPSFPSVRGAIVFASEDPGFTGGFTAGLTGRRARIVLPARWLDYLDPAQVELLVERRRAVLASGDWQRSRWLAIGWNLVGFALAASLPGAGVATVAELTTTALGFTLWTFVGLLLLPAPSRTATLRADARLSVSTSMRAAFGVLLRRLDRLQDDEPERDPRLESVFHPVPSVAGRLSALQSAPSVRALGAWHLARTSLYLSLLGLTPLPRLVHCNAGRPDLWVYLPADG